MSNSRAAAGVKFGQEMVGSRCIGIVGDVDSGSGGGTYRWLGGDIRDRDSDRQNQWEDTVENLISGTETNVPLASAPVLELHHPVMSMLGGHNGRL